MSDDKHFTECPHCESFWTKSEVEDGSCLSCGYPDMEKADAFKELSDDCGAIDGELSTIQDMIDSKSFENTSSIQRQYILNRLLELKSEIKKTLSTTIPETT